MNAKLLNRMTRIKILLRAWKKGAIKDSGKIKRSKALAIKPRTAAMTNKYRLELTKPAISWMKLMPVIAAVILRAIHIAIENINPIALPTRCPRNDLTFINKALIYKITNPTDRKE